MITSLNQLKKKEEIKAKSLELVPVCTMGKEPTKPQENCKFTLNQKLVELLNLNDAKEVGIIKDEEGFYLMNLTNMPEELKKGLTVCNYNKGTRTISNKPKYLAIKEFYDLGEAAISDSIDETLNSIKVIKEEVFFIAYKILSEEFTKNNIFVALLKLSDKSYIEQLNKEVEICPEDYNFIIGGEDTSVIE